VAINASAALDHKLTFADKRGGLLLGIFAPKQQILVANCWRIDAPGIVKLIANLLVDDGICWDPPAKNRSCCFAVDRFDADAPGIARRE
jgi:hypothetical protein